MKVQIVEYNLQWPLMFAVEQSLLAAAINIDACVIEHIGSTSVVGLGAKPIIDIMVGLPDFAHADDLVPNVVALGYDYIAKYNADMPFRRFFKRWSQGTATHNLHMVETGCDFGERHLLFRDYLRQHPEAVQAYESHKRELAEREWQDVNEYADAKTDFIIAMQNKARHWKAAQQ
jgi:GrpB-like predicted nucleotidyltransferase (UPF0157 family)